MPRAILSHPRPGSHRGHGSHRARGRPSVAECVRWWASRCLPRPPPDDGAAQSGMLWARHPAGSEPPTGAPTRSARLRAPGASTRAHRQIRRRQRTDRSDRSALADDQRGAVSRTERRDCRRLTPVSWLLPAIGSADATSVRSRRHWRPRLLGSPAAWDRRAHGRCLGRAPHRGNCGCPPRVRRRISMRRTALPRASLVICLPGPK